MRNRPRILGLAVLVPLFGGCGGHDLKTASGINLFEAAHVYTLVNLHPDEAHRRLYAANYQSSGLIPMCSEVKLDRLTKKSLVFTVLSTGRQYTYLNHKSADEPLVNHLQRYFGPACDQGGVSVLSAIDQEGVRKGTALVGMSKPGVIFALGYPPRRETPDTGTSNDWKYWHGRFNTFVVHFDGGVVTSIRD